MVFKARVWNLESFVLLRPQQNGTHQWGPHHKDQDASRPLGSLPIALQCALHSGKITGKLQEGHL